MSCAIQRVRGLLRVSSVTQMHCALQLLRLWKLHVIQLDMQSEAHLLLEG